MKKIKILSIGIPTLVILSFASTSLITSCDSSTYQDISAVVTDPTYSRNIQPIMAAKCTGCHSGGDEFPNLSTYEEVVDATADGKLLCKINGECGSIMPTSGKLPQATIDMIELWATNEYPN